MVSFPPGPSSAITASPPLLLEASIFSALVLITGSILTSLYTDDIFDTTLLASAFAPPAPDAFALWDDPLYGIYKIQKPWSYLTGVPSACTSLLTCMRASASVYLIWVPLIWHNCFNFCLSSAASLISCSSNIWKKASTWMYPCLANGKMQNEIMSGESTYWYLVVWEAFSTWIWLCLRFARL